jgi:hypothetical protein
MANGDDAQRRFIDDWARSCRTGVTVPTSVTAPPGYLPSGWSTYRAGDWGYYIWDSAKLTLERCEPLARPAPAPPPAPVAPAVPPKPMEPTCRTCQKDPKGPLSYDGDCWPCYQATERLKAKSQASGDRGRREERERWPRRGYEDYESAFVRNGVGTIWRLR